MTDGSDKERPKSSWRYVHEALRSAGWKVYAFAFTVFVFETARTVGPRSQLCSDAVRVVVVLGSAAVLASRLLHRELLRRGAQQLKSCARCLRCADVRRAKTTSVGEGAWYSYVSSDMQGWRDAMEDAMVCEPELGGALEGQSCFAIFDGHGGGAASAHAAQLITAQLLARAKEEPVLGEALQQALQDVEADLRRLNTPLKRGEGNLPSLAQRSTGTLRRFDYQGCTAAVAVLAPTCVTVINVGDSRVFKCRKGAVVPLSRDHKPESPRERKRITAAGGRVVKIGPCHRIDFGLNLSRCLGDFLYKNPNLAPEDQKVCPLGDVVVAEIDAHDEFMCVACDGLFELMTWQTVCEFIRVRIQRGMPLHHIAEALLDACCSTNIAMTGGLGTDNESVIIVKFDHDQRAKLA